MEQKNETSQKPLEILGILALIGIAVFLIITIMCVWFNDIRLSALDKDISELKGKVTALENRASYPSGYITGGGGEGHAGGSITVYCDGSGKCK